MLRREILGFLGVLPFANLLKVKIPKDVITAKSTYYIMRNNSHTIYNGSLDTLVVCTTLLYNNKEVASLVGHCFTDYANQPFVFKGYMLLYYEKCASEYLQKKINCTDYHNMEYHNNIIAQYKLNDLKYREGLRPGKSPSYIDITTITLNE